MFKITQKLDPTFIGPSASGKTSALCLLHFTAIEWIHLLGKTTIQHRGRTS
ncbi:MAG: hypothetical protein QXW69_06430 [Nitrososphaerota archaeon]